MVLSLFIRAVLLGDFTLLQERAHNSICQVGVYSRVYSRVVPCLPLAVSWRLHKWELSNFVQWLL